MSRNRYGGYRGRPSLNDWLRWIALFLLVLVVLAGAALLLGQRYIVYTDNGLRLELPFFREKGPDSGDMSGLDVLVEEPGAFSSQSQEEPDQSQPEETPAPVEQEEPLLAIALPLSAVLEGTALGQVEAAGANALVLEMKNIRGELGYQSALAQSGYGPEMNQALEKLSEHVTLVAKVSCFRDHRLAEDMACAIETNPGRRWSDADIIRWSNPAKAPVRAYLTGVAKELSGLGFDCLLLDNWGYPTAANGHLEYIKKGEFYDLAQVNTVISGFLDEMETALAGTGTTLALYCPADVVNGVQDQSGRTLARAVQVSGGLWVEDVNAAAQAIETGRLGEAELVQVSTVLNPDGAQSQAIIN